MTEKRMVIKIDVEDEHQQYKIDEPNVSTPAAVLELVDKGETSVRLGKYLLVARELEEAADILRPAKTELLAGASHDVNQFILRQKKIVTWGDRDVKVPVYKAEGLGRPEIPDEDDEDEDWKPTGFVRTDKPEAAEFAERHLATVVIGHLRNHLAIIRVSKGKNAMENAWQGWLNQAREVVEDLSQNGD